MGAAESRLLITERSGTDLDVWGGEVDRPLVVIPTRGTDEACVLKEGGACPAACRACCDFREEISKPQRTEETEDDHGSM